MKDKLKTLAVCIVLIGFAIGFFKLSTMTIEEGVEVQQFYISEAKDILTQETYYVLTNNNVRCKAEEPELILYCQQHVGETVNIKVEYIYDKANKEYTDMEFVSIEEDY